MASRVWLLTALIAGLGSVCLGCSGSGAGDSGADPGGTQTDGPAELVLPDLSGVDLPAAYLDALRTAQGITTTTAWAGHKTSLARRSSGCPDLYVGGIADADMGDMTDGIAWSDYCQPAGGGTAFSGWTFWDGSVQLSGDPADAAGQTIDASRSLSGDGLVSQDGDNLFELRGDTSESLYRVDAPDYQTWTWSSLVEATVTGSDASGTGASGTDSQQTGWRAELYLSATGSDATEVAASTLDLRGNAYLFAPTIADRFDSIDMDLSFGSDADCSLEPHGWISLRDQDAVWYDLVFLPQDGDSGSGSSDTGTDSYGACDGCGTLYIRGLQTVEYGEVCPDFSSLSAIAESALPDPGDFELTLREVLSMEAE